MTEEQQKEMAAQLENLEPTQPAAAAAPATANAKQPKQLLVQETQPVAPANAGSAAPATNTISIEQALQKTMGLVESGQIEGLKPEQAASLAASLTPEQLE